MANACSGQRTNDGVSSILPDPARAGRFACTAIHNDEDVQVDLREAKPRAAVRLLHALVNALFEVCDDGCVSLSLYRGRVSRFRSPRTGWKTKAVPPATATRTYCLDLCWTYSESVGRWEGMLRP
jgi:hypothetical protein